MSFRPSRLTAGESLIGAASLTLVVVLFAMQWYEVAPRFRDALIELGARVSASGWQTFTWVGPLCLLVGVLGVAAALLQVTQRSPALPVVTVTVLAPFSLLLVLVLVVRVLIALPGLQLPGGGGGTLQAESGAYVGLGLSLAILVGVWLSLRREGVHRADSPPVIETFRLGAFPGGPPAGPPRA